MLAKVTSGLLATPCSSNSSIYSNGNTAFKSKVQALALHWQLRIGCVKGLCFHTVLEVSIVWRKSCVNQCDVR